MHQPTETRKYQLFPVKDKLSIAAGQRTQSADPLQSTAAAGQQGTNEKERPLPASALRLKKEQSINRRRKASIPELGTMTTVQEVAMDSRKSNARVRRLPSHADGTPLATIPGRPPLHERSISAPGSSWRQHVFGESMLSCISGPAPDENAELAIEPENGDNTQAEADMLLEDVCQPLPSPTAYLVRSHNSSRSNSPKAIHSPKSLTPLVIPASTSQQPQRLNQQSSAFRLRPGNVDEGCDTPPDVPPKSAWAKEGSPHPRSSPYTPMSAASTLSASTAPTSVSNTPNSALPHPQYPVEGRSSPRQWSRRPSSPCIMVSQAPNHTRGQSQDPMVVDTLQKLAQLGASSAVRGHRRGESDGGASIINRGRPKNRSPSEGSPIKAAKSGHSPSIPSASQVTLLPTQYKKETSVAPTPKEKSDEQKAFEHLPSGHSLATAPSHLPSSELHTLRKQAVDQATRFQVLCARDVEALSRELRALDERCEYLRKTHRSLRSGRRNLHERICNYLRSPRVARFSHESMLRQEEALIELDTSIDDWVNKLEQAENRRTRVRQKLLEHVAAALMLSPAPSPTSENAMSTLFGSENRTKPHVALRSPVLDPNTPPRSPTKSSSPERLARVVEEVKVTSPDTPLRRGGRDVESIRIYADSDISALMADVEDEIKRMGELDQSQTDKEVVVKLELEKKKDDATNAGILLSAVAFEGMALHTQRSAGKLRA